MDHSFKASIGVCFATLIEDEFIMSEWAEEDKEGSSGRVAGRWCRMAEFEFSWIAISCIESKEVMFTGPRLEWYVSVSRPLLAMAGVLWWDQVSLVAVRVWFFGAKTLTSGSTNLQCFVWLNSEESAVSYISPGIQVTWWAIQIFCGRIQQWIELMETDAQESKQKPKAVLTDYIFNLSC